MIYHQIIIRKHSQRCTFVHVPGYIIKKHYFLYLGIIIEEEKTAFFRLSQNIIACFQEECPLCYRNEMNTAILTFSKACTGVL